MADFKTQTVTNGKFSLAELTRLKELRLKETEYTDDELAFMYKMHQQTDY